MKKILILTEHFPPTNKTAALRPNAWAHYLHCDGYYPIFITKTETEYPQVSDEINNKYRVIRVFCKNTPISDIRHKLSGSILGRFFGALDILLENLPFYSPLRYLEAAATKLIFEEKPIGMIVTAPSFSLFSIGRRISDKTTIKWIADYRDDWTTNEETDSFTRIKYKLEHLIEKHSLKNASAIFAVSDRQLEKIKKITAAPGFLVENGYDGEIEKLDETLLDGIPIKIEKDKLNIIYTGTLYKSQELDYLTMVLSQINPSLIESLRIIFLGVNRKQLSALQKYHDKIVFSCERINKAQADTLLQLSDLALYIAYKNKNHVPIKGVPSSKLYEYIKFKKPVLMLPSDKDISEKTLHSVGLAFYGTSIKESIKILEHFILEKKQSSQIAISINQNSYLKYSRKNSTHTMANYMTDIFQ